MSDLESDKNSAPKVLEKEGEETMVGEFREFMRNQSDMNSQLIRMLKEISEPQKKKPRLEEAGSSKESEETSNIADEVIEMSASSDNDALMKEIQEANKENKEDKDEEDPWADFNSGTHSNDQNNGEGGVVGEVDDTEMHIKGSQYRELLEQTEEVVGDPIDKTLAEICNNSWGKVKLSKDKKKTLVENIKIPSNCTVLKTPKLNTECYIRLYENGQSRDKGHQERQKETTRAAIPLYHAVGRLGALKQELTQRKAPAAVLKEITEINKQVQKSICVLNYSFTETTRKRKYDLCAALGNQFKPFAQGPSSADQLFDEETMKKMKSELKQVKAKGADFSAKNFSSLQKPLRGSNSGYIKKSYNNYNNSNNSNSNKSNFTKSRDGYRTYNNNNNNNNNNSNNNNSSRRKK